MMRKLTATGLAAFALAGVAGTSAAFASASHPPKPATATETRFSNDLSADRTSRDRHPDSSTDRSSNDGASHDRSSDLGDSTP